MNRIELCIYLVVLAVTLAGAWLASSDPDFFRHQLVVEDGPLEWSTVVGLMVLCALCLRRAVVLRQERARLFIGMTVLYAIIFFFGAGEELSWGQRIFGVESSEFFLQHNAQGETNLHNLVVNDTKLNKLIFAKGMALVFLIYLFVMTPLYIRRPAFRRFIDSMAIPIPEWRQVAAIIVLLVITQGLTDSSKKGEMLEFGAPFLVLVIFLFPRNRALFLRRDAGGNVKIPSHPTSTI